MDIAVVLLYGIFKPENSDYVGYLSFIGEEIKTHYFEKVILCGGITDPSKPDLSEAQSVVNYLREQNPDFENYILEEKSINTNQNIEFASKSVSPSDKVTVYCDQTRLAKVIWMAMHFLSDSSQEEIYPAVFQFAYERNLQKPFIYKNLTVIGIEFPGRTKEEITGQTFATLLDVMAIDNEKFTEMDIEQRRKDFGLN